MAEVTQLNELNGGFINLKYKLPGGQPVKLWNDDKAYYGTKTCKMNGARCYGLAASGGCLLVCEFGGSDAEAVIFKRM